MHLQSMSPVQWIPELIAADNRRFRLNVETNLQDDEEGLEAMIKAEAEKPAECPSGTPSLEASRIWANRADWVHACAKRIAERRRLLMEMGWEPPSEEAAEDFLRGDLVLVLNGLLAHYRAPEMRLPGPAEEEEDENRRRGVSIN